MTWFEPFSSAQIQHLAMTLIHNLWQGAIVALALVGLLRLIPARKAGLRYAACLMAMISVLVCGLATWGWLNIRAVNAAAVAITGEGLAVSPSPAVFSIWNWQLILVTAWLVGVLFMLCRLARSFSQIQQLKHKSRDASAEVQTLVAKIAKRCGLLKPLRVLVSDTISSAAVIGILNPVLFIPASMITGLNPSQLEAVIAHEIAHIRRFDPVVNFCQMLVEAVLFFNPAVAWIGGQIRMEREACCDVFGVTATGDESMYLDTLALWAEQMKKQGSSPTVGALAFADRQESTLLDRVRRVLFPDFVPATRFSPISTVFLFAIGLVLFASLWQGTMFAVQVADELLPHEQVVAKLTESRDQYQGSPVDLLEGGEETAPMTVNIKVETVDSQPTSCGIWVNYDNYVGNSSLNAGGGWIKPGKDECSFVVKAGWANILVVGDDYVPVTLFNVRPDKNGVANLVVPLRSGYPGEIEVVSESGEPIANATVQLKKGQSKRTTRRTSANSTSTFTEGPGVYADPLTTNADGVAVIEHATDQPAFQARVTASGFEQFSGPQFGIKEGRPHKIVMIKSIPVIGRVTGNEGQALADVKIYIQSIEKGHESRSGILRLNDKEFGKAAATTSESGEFTLDTLESGWTYNLIADAGDRGLRTCFGVRSGDEKIAIEIPGPINISGTVTGELDRLKRGDKYVLPYGTGIKSPGGSTEYCDSHGRVELSVADGKGTFSLENVLPSTFKFKFIDSKNDYFDASLEGVPVSKSIEDLEIVIPAKAPPGTGTATIARPVRLEFYSANGVAPFRGQVTVSSRQKDSEAHFMRSMEVVDGVVNFDVNAPTKLYVELLDAPGFVFEESSQKTELKIDAADGVFEEEVEVFPAGAVIGQINVAKRRKGTRLSVFGEMKWRDSAAFHSTGISDQCDEDGKFYVPNVPYGATVELMARYGANCKIIEPIEIGQSQPLFEATVTLEDVPALRGKVLDWQGKPFAHQTVSLRVLTEGKYRFTYIGKATTDRYGKFDFGPVNPDLGEYKVWIKSDKEHASTTAAVTDIEEPLEIKLERGLVIQGRLVNHVTGEPIANAEVYAAPEIKFGSIHAYEAEGKTDANGNFKFTNLNDGEYRLGARVLFGRPVNAERFSAGDHDVELRITTTP